VIGPSYRYAVSSLEVATKRLRDTTLLPYPDSLRQARTKTVRLRAPFRAELSDADPPNPLYILADSRRHYRFG